MRCCAIPPTRITADIWLYVTTRQTLKRGNRNGGTGKYRTRTAKVEIARPGKAMQALTATTALHARTTGTN